MPGVLTCLSCVLLNLKQNDLINRMKSPKKMKNPSSVQTIIPIAVAVDLEKKIYKSKSNKFSTLHSTDVWKSLQ